MVSRAQAEFHLGWPERQELELLLVLNALRESNLKARHEIKIDQAASRYFRLLIDDCASEVLTISYKADRAQSICATLGDIESNSDSVIGSLLKFPVLSALIRQQLSPRISE